MTGDSRMGKKMWTRISVFAPGNFTAVSLSKVRGDYTIENKEEFLKKFFNIKQFHSMSMPEIETKPKFKGKVLEFHVEKVGSKRYKIIGYREIFQKKGKEIAVP